MITIATLRAAGLSAEEILRVVELDQNERLEKEREQSKIRSRNYRARQGAVTQITRDARDERDATPHILPSSNSSMQSRKQESSQDVARAPAVPKYPAEFERFWAVYPRKTGKAVGLKAWDKAIKSGRSVAELIAGAERYRDDPNREAQYTKHPERWLNAGCEHDEPLPRKAQGNGRRHGSVLDAFDRLGEQLKAAGASENYVPGSSGPRPLELDQKLCPVNPRLISSR